MYRTKSPDTCLAWLVEKHEVQSSPAALSEFYSWFPLSRPLERSKEYARDFELALKADPNIKLNAEQISLAGQIAFEQQALQAGDVAAFIALRKLRQSEKVFELEREKFRELMKSGVEKGLDALQAEIKDNAEALELFAKLKDTVVKSMEAIA